SAAAVLPALSREWALGDGGRAGLTIAVQAGFIAGTLASALGNLPDVCSPRALMTASIVLGVVANGALALAVESLGPALALRFVTGVAMAGAYPPAMKIMATWFREGRGLAIGILIGALAVGAAGAFGCWVGGVVSDRWGRTTLTMAAMALSGACALVTGFTFGGPPLLTLALAIVWGVTVIADSAQFSTAITELSPAAYVGTALTTQTCAGFALTMASIWLVPPLVRVAGWPWAFAALAVGPA